MSETSVSRVSRLDRSGGRRCGLPAASWLALLGAGLAVGLTVSSARTTLDAGTAVGGVLVFVVPYMVMAVALRGRSVTSKGFGVGIAALMTWLTSFGVTEFVSSLRTQTPLRFMAGTFLVLSVVGLAVVAFGFRDLAAAVHATGYWTLTPPAGRLAFTVTSFWTLTFVADTYLTTNPPPLRMLLAPVLVLLHLGAALTLRAQGAAVQAAGLLLTVSAAATAVAAWVGVSSSLTPTAASSLAPGLGYSTLVPWPVLLAVSLALDAAIVAAWARRLRSRS